MLRSIAWIFFLVVLGLKATAQDIIGQPKTDLNSKAPEVAKMLQYIDFPVSYFTGAADINIPVHTLTSKGNKVGMSLHYHTGGIKAEEQSTFVGLGWMLDVGGSITRTIRGNKDEGIRYQMTPRKYTAPVIHYQWDTPTDSIAWNTHKYGGYYVDAGNNMPLTSTLSPLIVSHNQTVSSGGVASSDATSTFFNGLEDGEADLFSFSFGGYSGKFIFNASRTPVFIPYSQDFTVTPVLKTLDEKYPIGLSNDTVKFQSHYFESFKLSTTDGKDYYFGENDSARINTPNGDGFWTISSWLLTRVVDRTTLDTIYFSYRGANGGYTKVKNVTKFLNTDEVSAGCVNIHSGLGYEIQRGTIGKPLKITSSKEILNFYYTDTQLDSIKLSDKTTGVTYKKMQFDYGTTLSSRIKLVGFTVKDWKTNEYLPYSFSYYDTAAYGGIFSQDYWGYHNGVNNYQNIFPGYPSCTSNAANREPAWPAMKLDALTEVIYPTGGKTIFDYEPHMAYTGRKPDNSIVSGDAYFVGGYNNFTLPAMIGGIRVKRMLIYDPVTKDTLIRRFTYLNPDHVQSSGFLYTPPKLVSSITSFSCPSSTPGVVYYISTSPVFTGSGSGGHISYTHVQMQEEKNGLVNGHTEFDYYDDTNTDSSFYSNALTDSTNSPLIGPYDVMPDFMFRKLPENFLSGREKEKRVYNASGDLLLRETSIYKAKVYGFLDHSAVINAVSRDNICGPADTQPPAGGGPGGGPLYGTYQFAYDEDHPDDPPEPVLVPLSQNGGNRGRPLMAPPLSFYFFYPYSTQKAAVRLYRKIVESHPSTLGYTIDTTTYTFDNTSHINPTMITTRDSKGQTTQQRTLYSLDFNDVNGGDSTFYFMRKAGMNVPMATFNYKNGNITGGGYRQYKMRSRADSTIFLPSNEYSLNVQSPGITPATINVGSTLPQTFNFPAANFANVAAYKYNSDNTVAYITKKGSDKVVFLWDYNKNFVVALASNADSTDIAFTGFETAYNGNWSVAGTARVTSSSITGKQSYSLSSGNITRTSLNAAKSYIVSYWSLTSAATVNSTTATAGNVKRGWHYFEHKLPAATTSVTISGAVTIDDLRLYPADAQMTTYAFEPLVGVTASVSPNSNITYYEYDGVGKLRFVRDADNNIVKAAQYFYTVYGKDTAIWRSANGNTRLKPCAANTLFNSNTIQKQQIDINPNSSTFGTLQWADAGSCIACDISSWQDTAVTVRCAKDAGNNNTGYQEKKQKDMNPCSGTYSQARWVSIGQNLTACPVPCVGADRRIINGVCVVGQRVNTASVWNAGMQKYACTYHYEWLPDCIKGSDITEYNATPCSLGSPCIPD